MSEGMILSAAGLGWTENAIGIVECPGNLLLASLRPEIHPGSSYGGSSSEKKEKKEKKKKEKRTVVHFAL